jgi:hypothetical protein
VDPSGHHDGFFSLAAVLVFAWLLAAIGSIDLGLAGYALLAVAFVFIAAAGLRRRV